MGAGFSEAFSQLRKERGISQRQVAADLGMSQALLSHYENGIREPKLDFVVKACEYYNVSADYILGRTQVRDNPMSDFVWNGDDAVRLIDSMVYLMDRMASVGDGNQAVRYFEAAVYKLCGCGDSAESALCDGFMKITEAQIAVSDCGSEPNECRQLDELINEMRKRLNIRGDYFEKSR